MVNGNGPSELTHRLRPLPPAISNTTLYLHRETQEITASYRLGSTPIPSPPPTCFTYSRSSKVGPAMQLVPSPVHKTTLCTYDLYGPVRNVFDAGRYIIGGEVGGWGWRWKSRVFWAPNDTRLTARAISQGPTKLEISSANPTPPLPHLMYLPASKTLRTRPYKS
jgi:hypothetical protein